MQTPNNTFETWTSGETNIQNLVSACYCLGVGRALVKYLKLKIIGNFHVEKVVFFMYQYVEYTNPKIKFPL